MTYNREFISVNIMVKRNKNVLII